MTSDSEYTNEPSGANTIADGEITFTLTSTAVGQSTGVIFRAADNANHYLLLLNHASGSVSVVLYKKVSNSYSQIAGGAGNSPWDTSSIAQLTGQTYRWMVRFYGAYIELYVNGRFLAAWTDSTYTSAGQMGFYCDTSTIHVQNVKCYTTPDWSIDNVDMAHA